MPLRLYRQAAGAEQQGCTLYRQLGPCDDSCKARGQNRLRSQADLPVRCPHLHRRWEYVHGAGVSHMPSVVVWYGMV